MPQGLLKKSNILDGGLSSSGRREKGSLDFGMVEVYHFPVTVGDNPHVSEGCPIMLGWESEECVVLSVDSYEQFVLSKHNSDNNKSKSNSKGRDSMKLSVQDRAQL